MIQDWQKRFDRFDAANPHVYRMFEKFTFQVIDRGRKRFSSSQVLGRMRWYAMFETDEPEFKINQNYCTYLGRKFMRLHPEHEGFYRLRAIGEERDGIYYHDTPKVLGDDAHL